MMAEQKPQKGAIKLWLNVILRMSLFAVALLWPAGTPQWWEAWVVIGLWTVFSVVMTVYLSRFDPALLEERMKMIPIQRDQKAWDKLMMLLFTIAGIALYIVPGFDVVRYQWSESFPVWMEVIAMVLHLPCFWFLWWVMHENTYLSQVVKIDDKRGHHVITTGPYAIVRHPMYFVIVVLLFAVPVALGSRYSLVLSLILTLLMIVRTYFEDRTLHDELPGYTEYAKQTRYRLVPGLW
jgi:protein-S-isoprenylcysteine O-methyltransferase Ste14